MPLPSQCRGPFPRAPYPDPPAEIVPLRGERCASHSRRGCAPDPTPASQATLVKRAKGRAQLDPWRRASGSSRAIAGLQPAAHTSAARHTSQSERRESNPHRKTWQIFALPIGLVRKHKESGHRDSNSAGTVWKTGFSPREIPADGRPYSHHLERAAGAFGTAGAHVRNRTESASIPTRCTAIVLHRQAQRGATRPRCYFCGDAR